MTPNPPVAALDYREEADKFERERDAALTQLGEIELKNAAWQREVDRLRECLDQWETSCENAMAERDAARAEVERLIGERDLLEGQLYRKEQVRIAIEHNRDILRADNERLAGALREIVKDAPVAEDFETGQYAYSTDCGNYDDIETLGMAREHFRLADIARTTLASLSTVTAPDGQEEKP